jgi:hypothetical protein
MKDSFMRGHFSAELKRRAERGDVGKALAILDRAGMGNPPMPGDDLTKA